MHHFVIEFQSSYTIFLTLYDKVCQLLAAGRWFFPAPPPRYNWNIVESGVKHHKPNHLIQGLILSYFCLF